MTTRRLSLAVMLLFLAGMHLMFVGGGGSVNAELPFSPPADTDTVIVTTDAFSRITLPVDMPRYDIPLPLQLQKFIWKMCLDHTLSYEFVLSVIYAESNFVIGAVGVTKDLGLMQLNPYNTVGWLADKVGIKNFDPMNPYHNVEAGVWYLAYIRDYWEQYGVSHERTFELILLSYNRGINGATTHVKRLGAKAYESGYVLKVSQFKQNLEKGAE